MRLILFLLLATATLNAQTPLGDTAIACQSGRCSGYAPPIGGCNTGAYTYTNLAPTPTVAYSCQAGAWVLQGTGTGSGVSQVTNGTGITVTNPTTTPTVGLNPATTGGIGGVSLGTGASAVLSKVGSTAGVAGTDYLAPGYPASVTNLSSGYVNAVSLNPTTASQIAGSFGRFATNSAQTCLPPLWAGLYQDCLAGNFITTNAMPGYSLGSNTTSATGWSFAHTIGASMYDYARGISGFIGGTNDFKYSMGDSVGFADYKSVWGGQTQSADEGVVPLELHANQIPYLTGTLSAGAGTGSNLITATVTAGLAFSDGGTVLDTQAASYTASLTANAALDTTLHGLYYTTSGATFPAALAVGAIIPSTCTAGLTGQSLQSSTCTVQVSSGVFAASTATTQHACSAATEEEEFQITSVGTLSGGQQAITFNTKYAWNGSIAGPVFQNASGGGLCGKYFVATSTLTANSAIHPYANAPTAPLPAWPIAYMALGSTNGTSLYFGSCRAGSCNAGGGVGGFPTPNVPPTGTAITVYPGAEITGTNGGTSTQANLGSNSVAWTNGDSLIGAPTSEFGLAMIRLLSSVSSPSVCSNLIFGCAQHIGIAVDEQGTVPLDIGIHFDNNFTATNPTSSMIYSGGAYGDSLRNQQLPTDALIRQEGNLSTGSTQTSTNIYSFVAGGVGSGNAALSMAFSNLGLNWTGPFVAQTVSGNTLAATTGGITAAGVVHATPYSASQAFIADTVAGTFFSGGSYGSWSQGTNMGGFGCQFDFGGFLCGIDTTVAGGGTDPGSMLLVGTSSIQSPQTTVTSASTIAFASPGAVITGTTAISTITAPYGAVRSSGTLDVTCTDVLATGAWTTNTSGNIQAAMTAVANTSYRFCYWPVISKWTVK